ncbi:hypothetical protein MHC_02985 [Mycoplasma haemocanis str. Illinois]|uniref:Uncharacterized protein n=1 Tax=Mycoplasma haemocanis (strain Illinois) TaxID=1111676 RepID=H6N737_MYCHN|nr:hypothetical protein [Mycoplasma haemocanis]AEW45459.1 hypothetical protein MHC_02985 [Mycoplasma haemocanis str. Illinois]
MKTFMPLILLGVGTAGIGGWYKFHHLKPKTLRQYLEWQGLRLISDSEANYWKAVLEENQELIKKLDIGTSNIEGLKEWCKKHIDTESYEDLKENASLLCVDNPKTVKARIIQLDGDISKLMSSGDDNKYKVAYVFRKHINGFHDLIGYKPQIGNNGKELEDLPTASAAFKKWCEDSLKRGIEETLIFNVRTFCTPKSFSSILELITQNGESDLLLTNGNNASDLSSKYESIKELDSWKEDSENSARNVNDLKKWCEENRDKNFYEKEVFSKVYPKFRFRCLKGSGDEKSLTL